MDYSEETHIIISVEEYDRLLKDSCMLSALEEAGVDNWVGYSFARDIFIKEYGLEE